MTKKKKYNHPNLFLKKSYLKKITSKKKKNKNENKRNI